MGTMKRLLIVLAAVFAAASTSALAGDPAESKASKAVQMTDAQLDEITAAAATTLVTVFNSGNALVEPKVGKNHLTCVNCTVPLPGAEGTAVVLVVINRRHPLPNDAMIKCLAGCPGL